GSSRSCASASPLHHVRYGVKGHPVISRWGGRGKSVLHAPLEFSLRENSPGEAEAELRLRPFTQADVSRETFCRRAGVHKRLVCDIL
ncbi:MAG: hypothetical protein LBI86_06245, partial [Treponema sp.]|nr:hypothetical protein [Treponema sp.]